MEVPQVLAQTMVAMVLDAPRVPVRWLVLVPLLQEALHSHVFAALQAGQKHDDKCAAVGTGMGLPKQVRPCLACSRRQPSPPRIRPPLDSLRRLLRKDQM